MASPPRYLAPHTLLEPLVDRWPAWWMTVAPLPSALHARRYQIALMQGYLQSPDFHARAGKDRKMSGGPFIAVEPHRKDEVRQLLDHTLSSRRRALEIAEAYEQFEQRVLNEAKGGTLQGHYLRAPEPLRGLFELVYDYHQRPSLRLIEGLTYTSDAYLPELQSVELSVLTRDLQRPSWLSTPRMREASALELAVPFKDARLDWLYGLDLRPQPLESIRETFGLPASALPLLEAMTTPEAPRPHVPWSGPGMRVSYLGHATVLVECAGVSLLVDPVISPVTLEPAMERATFRDLPPRIDYVLITHAHADHFSLESLLRLRHRIGTLVVPQASGALVGDVSLALLARQLGFRNVVELGTMDTLSVSRDVEILAAPFLGEHGDLAHAKTAYLVRSGDSRLLFAADSAALDPRLYERLRAATGPIQTVFLNTETEGSPLTFSLEALFPRDRNRLVERDRRCRGSTAEEGGRLLEAVGARSVFNYAMGLEPWLEHITGYVDPTSDRMKDSEALIANARARGLRAERLCGLTQLTFPAGAA